MSTLTRVAVLVVCFAAAGCGSKTTTMHGRYIASEMPDSARIGSPCSTDKSLGTRVLVKTGSGEQIAFGLLGLPVVDWSLYYRIDEDSSNPSHGKVCVQRFLIDLPKKSPVYLVSIDDSNDVTVSGNLDRWIDIETTYRR